MHYFQNFTKGQNVVIHTDHAALRWLMNFSGSDAMYYRRIAEMESYEPYKIICRSGEQHRNADGMSRARKHCKVDNCMSCEYHHNRNRVIWDSDSVNSI